MSLLSELKRRNVLRVMAAYVAVSWLLIQVVETLFPVFGLSDATIRAVVIGLAIGFVPAIVAAWAFELTPDGVVRDSEVDRGSAAVKAGAKRLDRIVMVTLALAVGYFAIDKFIFDPARDEAEIVAAAEQATKLAISGAFLDEFDDRSVLVVPFLNLSSDPEQEFFADGISEELLNQLARIEELRVISRSTSWTFKGQDVNVADVHHELDVSHILEGSVRKSGNQVRVTAQLIDARTDTHLWSETYDESLEDIFAIQEEISVAVADRLHLEVFSSKSPHEGVDPRAYELYLRASFEAGNNAKLRADARRMLEEALTLEPDYLPALYNLAAAVELSEEYNVAERVQERRQFVTETVNRMIELAPDSAYVSNWQAYMAMQWNNDLIGAAPYLEKSMRFANRTDVHIWFSGAIDLLNEIGRHEEAVTVGQYWINRDPYCGNCLGKVVRSMSAAGRHAEAALIAESQLKWREVTEPMLWNIGVAFLIGGDAERALHYFDQIPETSPIIDRKFARAFALYSLGRIDEFESILEEFTSGSGASSEGIARLYAWSNRPDESFEWLERMVVEQGEESAMLIKTALYEPIKSDSRWEAFLEKYGAEDKDRFNVKFEPQYPPTLQRAVDALLGR
jgi:TolB-like protein